MATAANLTQAADQADQNLYPFWLANTIETRLADFATTCLALFPESDVKSHPTSNWLILISHLANQMPGTNASLAQFETAVQYVFRCCLMTQELLNQALISAPNAAAVLASYNLQF